jgi:integrase
MRNVADTNEDARGWYIVWRDDSRQWELTYRTAPGPKGRKKHRLPRAYGAGERERAEKYSAGYVATKRARGFPPAKAPTPHDPARPVPMTFGSFALEWTSGKLNTKHADHVRLKRTSGDDASKVALLAPVLGHVLLSAFSLDHAERAMRQLDELRNAKEREAARIAERPARKLKPLSPSSRRQYAQCIHKLLSMAVYPARLIPAHPLPRGFLPKPNGARPLNYLYPDEDAKLLAHGETPLVFRVLFGFLAREGMREGEAMGLRWRDVDLQRGAVKLDENKTDDPRAWALSPGVTVALTAWRARQDAAEKKRVEAVRAKGEHVKEPTGAEREAERGARFVFADEDGRALRADSLADRFRDALHAAGVTRAELFETRGGRMKIRVHDLRATFVTLSLANGKTEAWVSARTGHRSSAMLNRYRRAATKVEELALGDLRPLDVAIPELTRPPPAKPAPEAVAAPAPEPPATPSARRALVAELVAAALVAGARERRGRLFSRVGRAGLEPATYGLKVRSSTD